MKFYYKIRNSIRNKLKNSVLGKIILSLNQKPASGIIHIISATRLTEEKFWQQSALGQSLTPFRDKSDLAFHIHYENTYGLSSIYNQYISRNLRNDILVFIHDDVWFDTETWVDDIRKGLGRFDVIGVAGNRRLPPQHPGWPFHSMDAQGFHWDTAFLSGEVGHGKHRNGVKTKYGHVPMECKLLDGVLIATRCKHLLGTNTKFDERFFFHFYDLDFCRLAIQQGLVLGTWDIKITHQSPGAFGTTDWHRGYKSYLKKWNEKN